MGSPRILTDQDLDDVACWEKVVGYQPEPRIKLEPDHLTDFATIGAEIGVNRQRAHQIYQAALLKCRRWATRNGYRLEDLLDAQ